MREVKENREAHWTVRQKVEERSSFYDDLFRYGERGEYVLEKREVTFQRETLYEEIWQRSLTKVAKKYGVPYQKLKEACEASGIPLPSPSYWGDLYVGKPVQKIPLPESSCTDVTVSFSVRTGISPVPAADRLDSEAQPVEKMEVQHDNDAAVAVKVVETTPPSESSDGRNLYRRESLYEEVWKNPVTKVAERYGVSDVMIHKVCKVLNIPVPPRGYWAKKEAGEPVEQTPLPPHTRRTEVTGRRTDESEKEAGTTADEALSFLSEDERELVVKTALQLQVDPGKRKLHPVLLKHKASYAAWKKVHPRDPLAAWNRDLYRRIPEGEPIFYEAVSEDALPRLYRILDALYSAVETLGGSINQNLSVRIRGEEVWFTVSESQEQAKHALTKVELRQVEQYENDKRAGRYAREPKFRKYDYLPTGRLTFSPSRGSYVKDSTKTGLEDRVGELLLGLYMESEIVRLEREAREAEKRRAEEAARRKELLRQKYNEEIDRLEALKNEAADYQMACRIRAYVSAVESQPDLGQAQIEWITWARAKADWYDPTKQTSDPIFGKRNHSAPHEPQKQGSRWW